MLSILLCFFIGSEIHGYAIGDANSINCPGINQELEGDGFQLAGRSLVGDLPRPLYDTCEEGIIVVEIKVDRNGYVVGAEYEMKSSTIQNSCLVSATIRAATRAKFNKDHDAPAFVSGTITYHFELDRVKMEDEEKNSQEEIERQKKAINSNVHNAFGKSTGASDSFQLKGRSLQGSLPKPAYDIQESGTVVVKITVDRTGRVVSAKYTLRGSTTQNSRLKAAAQKAALKARFNADPNASAYVKGTITYHFELD